jgi:5-hydroxyisourate hydrolase
MSITTHVLDTSRGRPAADVAVSLEHFVANEGWRRLGQARTDDDGRIKSGLAPATLSAGNHRLRFDTGEWFRAQNVEAFYPEVQITFVVRNASEHHHVPLLLSPFGYSTYRGS